MNETRLEGIGKLLQEPVEQTAPNNQARCWRTDCDFLYTEFGEARALLELAIPHLRTLAYQCEACGGSGELVLGSDDESAYGEPCKHCKPLWDLIERMEPPAAPPPQPVVEEVEDDIAF